MELTKSTVAKAIKKLAELDKKGIKNYSFSNDIPRELKAEADLIIEKLLIDNLSLSGLNIMSEESGAINSEQKSRYRFIIDPIDGTVNFIRKINQCSISVALFDGNKPVFGVLGSYPSLQIAWGGKEMGAFLEEKIISVSSISSSKSGVLCTGYPSRFDFNANANINHLNLIQRFNKVRMLGSASQSLLMIAQGSVEAYFESNIMIWDVAAGLAIVEGAGGYYEIKIQNDLNSPIEVFASNNKIYYK